MTKWLILITVLMAAVWGLVSQNKPVPDNVPQDLPAVVPDLPKVVVAPPPPPLLWEEFEVKYSVYAGFVAAGIPPRLSLQLIEVGQKVKNLTRIPKGLKLKLGKRSGGLEQVVLRWNKRDSLEFKLLAEEWQAAWVSLPLTYKRVLVSGVIQESFWDSAYTAGLDPKSIGDFAAIFAWQLDFGRELRRGDTWKVLINQSYLDGQKEGWGKIFAVEFRQKNQEYIGIRFPQDGREFYDLQGQNLRGKFLKSPLKFTRISSRFRRQRFHPVLKIRRPHYGVDYAAARGTPVRSVGDGRVVILGWRGGSGKTVKVRHNSVYQTAYKHLSRYGKKLRLGSKVKQGQIIGYVGATGLATGPHLHFEFYERGVYKDPLGHKFPREESLARKLLPDFKRYCVEIRQLLDMDLAGVKGSEDGRF